MKIKDMEINYIHLKAEPEAVQQRMNAAFDVIFDSVWPIDAGILPHPLSHQSRLLTTPDNFERTQSR